MNYQEKAEQYVRGKLPELGFTVVCRVSEKHPTGVRKTWRKPQLHHWLRVFENIGNRHHYYLNIDGELIKLHLDEHIHAMWFNLTTGQPATEADYCALCDILKIG